MPNNLGKKCYYCATMSTSRRGIQTLFNDLLEIPSAEKQRKGRSESFDAARNECMIHRYIYFANLTGWRYELIIKLIAAQFWISERTVQNILTENNDQLRSIRKELPPKKEMEKRWPYLSWEMPELNYYL